MIEMEFYNWYQQVKKKDLGETRVDWLQYLLRKNVSTIDSCYDRCQPIIVKEEVSKVESKESCKEIETPLRQSGLTTRHTQLENEPNIALEGAPAPSAFSTPQHERESPYLNFFDKSFVTPPPLTLCGEAANFDESRASSIYSPTIPMVDFFSPAKSDGDGSRTEGIVTSLGANFDDSSVAWTSALATPSTASSTENHKPCSTPSTLERLTLHPNPQQGLRQKVMARTLFSPRTPGGQTSSSDEWSPNLGIIKCHSPVSLFNVKGHCSDKKNVHRIGLPKLQVEGTQAFRINENKDTLLDKDLKAAVYDEKTGNSPGYLSDSTNVESVSKNWVRCKTSTHLAEPQPLVTAVLEILEGTNSSQCDDPGANAEGITKSRLKMNIETNLSAGVIEDSEDPSLNPFDIICSPVKKKARVSKSDCEVLDELQASSSHNLEKEKREVKGDEQINESSVRSITENSRPGSRATSSGQVKATEDNIKSTGIEMKVGSQQNKHAAIENPQVIIHKDESLVMQNDKIHVLDSRVTCAPEKVSLNEIPGNSCKDGSCPISLAQAFKTDTLGKDVAKHKIFHKGEKLNIPTTSPALPVRLKNVNTSRLSLLHKRKRSSDLFLYPTKSKEVYEKLNVNFNKALITEESNPNQNNSNSIVGTLISENDEQLNPQTASTSDAQEKLSYGIQIMSDKEQKFAPLTELGRNDRLHNRNGEERLDFSDEAEFQVVPEIVSISGKSVVPDCSKVTLPVSEEKQNTVSQCWNDSLNEADMAELEKEVSVQSRDNHPLNSLIQPYVKSSKDSSETLDDSDLLPMKVAKPSYFEGFSTGLGKTVKVSATSLSNARKIFDDVDGDKPVDVSSDKRDNTETCSLDNLQISVEKQRPITGGENQASNEIQFYDSQRVAELPSPSICGFKRASGASVNISSTALKRAKVFLEEEIVTSEFGEKVNDFSESHMIGKGAFNSPKESCLGFKTAEGIAVPLNEKLSDKSGQLWNEANYISEISDMRNTKGESHPDASDQRCGVDKIASPKPGMFQGFSTASGSKIKVNEESLKKAQLLLEEDKSNDANEMVITDSEVMKGFPHEIASKRSRTLEGFSTASGSKIKVCEESIKKAQSLWEENQTDDVNDGAITDLEVLKEFSHEIANKSCGAFEGFSTAAGSKVKVREESLKKAQSLWEENHDKNVKEMVMTNSEKFHKLSHEVAITKPKAFEGFSTASGSKIKISEESLKKVQNLWEDDKVDSVLPPMQTQVEIDRNNVTESFRGDQDVMPMKSPVIKSRLSKSKMAEQNNDSDELNVLKFRVAVEDFAAVGTHIGSRQCKESEMERIDDEDTKSEMKESKLPKNLVERSISGKWEEATVRPSFTSASDQSNEIVNRRARSKVFVVSPCKTIGSEETNTSKDAFGSALELQLDGDASRNVQGLKLKGKEAFLGFSTGCGREINVSAMALEKVKSIFAEEAVVDDTHVGNYNDKSNLEKSLTSHSSSITSAARPKLPFLSIDQEVDGVNVLESDKHALHSELTGFSTGNGRKVKVNESSLTYVKNLFKDEDTTTDVASHSPQDHKNHPELIVEKEKRDDTTESQSSIKCVIEKKFTGFTSPLVRKKKANFGIVIGSSKLPDSSSAIERRQNLLGDLCKEPNNIAVPKLPEIASVLEGVRTTEIASVLEGVRTTEIGKSDDEMIEEDVNEEARDDADDRSLSPIIGSQSLHVKRKDQKKKKRRSQKSLNMVNDGESMVFSGSSKMKCKGSARVHPLNVDGMLDDTSILKESENAYGQSKCRHKHSDKTQQKSHSQPTGNISKSCINPAQLVHSQPPCKIISNQSCNKASLSKKKAPHCDTQEICNVTEAFLQDESSEVEDSSKMKRKVHRSDDDDDVDRHAPKMFKPATDVSQPIDIQDVRLLVDKAVLEESELLRIKQEHIIRHKRKHSVKPIQGMLHKERADNMQRRISLKSLGTPKIIRECSVRVQEITGGNASLYRFPPLDKRVGIVDCGEGCSVIPGPDGCVGAAEVERGFLSMPGVCPGLVPTGWVSNHYRWIVWSLAAMERRLIQKKVLTLKNLIARLKYRHDREIDRAERPILRKITEHDDIPQKTMVLCIVSIKEDKQENGSGNSLPNLSSRNSTNMPFLTLTDGWYSIGAVVDNAMLQIFSEGKIHVGTKLVIHGAELTGPPNPCHPLEAPSSLNLRLHTNMTRKARWWSRLGLIPQKSPLPTQLGAILGDGGIIGRITAKLSRVYPPLYFERLSGSFLFRGEKAHLRLVRENQLYKETTLHQIVTEVEKEFEKERAEAHQNGPNRQSLTNEEIRGLTMGKEIAHLLENTLDPTSLEGLLTENQIELARSWQQRQADERRRRMDAEVQRRLLKKQKLYEATPLLKLRILDVDGYGAMLTVWRPPEELRQALLEGMIFNIHYVAAAGYRRGCLQLTGTRQTRWERVTNETAITFPDFHRHVTPLCLTMSDDLKPTWKELDVVGAVFRIGQMEQGSQLVYIVDHHVNVLALKFWGGLKECGVEDMVSIESVICVSNGSWHGYSHGRCGCVHVTELTTVSVSPRRSHLEEAVTHLKDSIKDMKTLLRQADMKLDGQFDERAFSALEGDCSISNRKGTTDIESNDVTETWPACDGNQAAGNLDITTTPKVNRQEQRSREIRCKLKALGQYGTPSAVRGFSCNSSSSGTHRPFKAPFKQLN